jgi:hypothetical protein
LLLLLCLPVLTFCITRFSRCSHYGGNPAVAFILMNVVADKMRLWSGVAWIIVAGVIMTMMLKGKEPGDELRVVINVFAFLSSAWYSVALYRKKTFPFLTLPLSLRASGRAVMLAQSQLRCLSALRAAGFHPMTQRQRRLAASVPEAPPCRAVACAPCTPSKNNGRRAVRHAAPDVAAGPCSVPPGASPV